MKTVEQMIADLLALDLSQGYIAGRIGVSQPTVHRAAKDASGFRYLAGKRLEALHAEFCGRDSEAA